MRKAPNGAGSSERSSRPVPYFVQVFRLETKLKTSIFFLKSEDLGKISNTSALR